MTNLKFYSSSKKLTQELCSKTMKVLIVILLLIWTQKPLSVLALLLDNNSGQSVTESYTHPCEIA